MNNFLFRLDSPEIIQLSKLSTDEEINQGRLLVINCNADVVMVPDYYTTITGVIIKRRLYGNKDFEEIVNYGINSADVINVRFPLQFTHKIKVLK